MLRTILASLGFMVVSGCTVLTADAPLLIGEDDAGFSVHEGLWALHDPQTCKLDPRRSDPGTPTCIDWARIERVGAGVWRADSVPPDEKGSFLVRVARAGDSTYLGESIQQSEIVYLVLAPEEAGRKPPFRRLFVRVIACDDMVHEGLPPPGVELETDPKDGTIKGCKVSSAAAAMAAAQLTLRAHPDMVQAQLFVFVRP